MKLQFTGRNAGRLCIKISLLPVVPNVQVSDTTDDAMKNYCWLPKKKSFKELNVSDKNPYA